MEKKSSLINRIEIAFGKWVIKRRWWILGVSILLVLSMLNGMSYLTFNADNRVFFSEDNPQLLALEALENTYNKSNSLLITIAPKNGELFTRETLSAIEELTEAAWQIPYSSRVNSITNFQYTRVEDDDLIVEDLVQNAANMSESDLKEIKNIVLSEPELVNYLIAESGDVTGLFVEAHLPGESKMEVPQIAWFARNLAEDFRKKYPDLKIYLTGGIMIDNAFGEVGMHDMSTLIPLMFLILIVIVGLALRSFTGTLGTFIIIMISMITGLGAAGWLGMVINAASSNAPTIILTLAVADSVHILITIFEQMRQGKSKHEAIAESLRINLQPVFLTSITTAIGFLTMNFSDAPPYRDLGNIVAIGVIAAFVYSVTFLPALIAVLPVRVKSGIKSGGDYLDKLADFVISRRRVLFWGTLVFISLITTGISRLELQDDWIKYFAKSYQIRQDTDFTESNLTGLNTLEYSLESGEPGGINSPEYLTKVEQFAEWYRKQPKVAHVASITNTIKRLNQNMHSGDKAYYRIPKQRDLAAQYLLLYEMSLPFGLDLNNRININKSATRLIVFLRNTTTNELRELEKKGDEWLKTNAPEHMISPATGLTITWAHLSQRNINSLLGGSFWALLLISVIMIMVLRSFKLGLLSLIPNLAPAFMAFGLWGFMVGQAGLGISIIAAMTLGIVVDDTVHFISKYLRARREYKMDSTDAIRYSFNTVGKALWVTTLALVAGFMVLSLSGFRMNSDMGLMAAITITLALALDFLFLPPLLMLADRKKHNLLKTKKEKTDETIYIKSFENSTNEYNPVPDVVAVSVESSSISRNSGS